MYAMKINGFFLDLELRLVSKMHFFRQIADVMISFQQCKRPYIISQITLLIKTNNSLHHKLLVIECFLEERPIKMFVMWIDVQRLNNGNILAIVTLPQIANTCAQIAG